MSREDPVGTPDRTPGRTPGRTPLGARRRYAVAALLLCLLSGFALAAGVRHHDSADALDDARPADLVVLLDSLQQREAALTGEITDLQRTLASLRASDGDDRTAVADARARLDALRVLVGTVAATGPGVVVTVADPSAGMSAETLLDVVNELRAAGAEASEIRAGSVAVRVGVDTAITGAAGALRIDGRPTRPPYTVVAIGDAPTLAAALTIPGGASDNVRRVGGDLEVAQSPRVEVTALRQPKQRQYARPVG